MRRLRYTAVLALLIGTLTACGSSLETAAEYVESGKALVKEGKVEKARLEFKNALQIDPRTASAFYELALLDEKAQDWKSMYKNLSTTEQLDPLHSDALVKLGQLYLLSGNYEQARERAKKVLDINSEYITALVLRASIELKQQNFGLAMKDADKVLGIDEYNTEAMSIKALSYSQQGNSEAALRQLEEALKVKPDELSLIMIKLSILEDQKDYGSVEKIYRDLHQAKPSERWVVVSLAKLLNVQGRYEEAKQILTSFVEAQPDDRDAKLMLVSLVQTRDLEQAIVLLDQFSAADQDDFDLLFAKIKLQLDSGKTDDALSGLAALAKKDPDGNSGRKAEMILANYEFRQGKMGEVKAKLDHVLSVAPEDEAALILKSKVNILEDKIDTAITDLRVVLRNNLESDEAMVLLGQAYLTSGSVDLAEDHFRQALSVNSGNRLAAIFVADNLMRSDNIERAESVILAALQDKPTDQGLLQILANIKLQKEDWAGVAEISSTLGEQGAKLAVTSYLDAQVLQGQGKHAEAIEKYKEALDQDTSMLQALQGIAYNYIELGERSALDSYLRGLIEQDSDYFMAYALLAELYINEKDWAEVIAISEQGIAVDPRWQRGYLMLSAAQKRAGNEETSIETLEKGMVALPQDNMLALRLASAYEGERQFEKAKALYESILDRTPDVAVAINNLASLLTDQFRSDENLKKALKISESFADSQEPYFLDTYAWVNVQLGNLEKAQTILERVIVKAPNVAVFNYHLGTLYYKKADKISAEKYLKLALSLAQKQNDTVLINQIDELLPALQP